MRWRMPALAVLLLGLSKVALAGPGDDDLVQRRAIRGAPVDGVRESDELRQLREFEEASFARPVPGADAAADDRGVLAAEPSPASATSVDGRSGVGPDAIPETLRSPTPARAETSAAPAIPWLSSLRMPDLPVRLDPRVVRYLEFYKNDPKGRAIMSSWLRRQGRYRAMMEAALEQAHLPRGLLYVSMIESSYDPHDRSHAGAVGLWQFMPENGHIYGLRIDHWVDERKDAEKATLAVMRYFADLKARFGAWPLAMAAFNAGYGAVLRSMHKYNTNDYWELCRHENGLPWETTLYVPKLMAAAIVGENRALFGYDDVAVDPPLAWERVSVDSSMSLGALAAAAGVPEAQIALLNPQLRRGRTPPGEARFEVHVPRGSAQRFAAAYERSREAVRAYVVRFGERLDDVAHAFSIAPKALKALNGLVDSSELRPGLTIVVPAGRTPLPPPPCDTVVVAVPDKDAVVSGKKRIFYRTLPTDSIDDVARFFGVRPPELSRWNNLDPEARLVGNLVLQLWVAPEFDQGKAALVDANRVRVVTVGSDEFFELEETKRGRARLSYTVKAGDDLKKIGKRYGLTVADLERINRFGARHAPLTVGQKLTVYRAMTAAEKQKAMCKLVPGGGTSSASTPSADDSGDDASEADEMPASRPTADKVAKDVESPEGGRPQALPRPPPP
jgi:membrane-bound lytic murein transglycosylase D